MSAVLGSSCPLLPVPALKLWQFSAKFTHVNGSLPHLTVLYLSMSKLAGRSPLSAALTRETMSIFILSFRVSLLATENSVMQDPKWVKE